MTMTITARHVLLLAASLLAGGCAGNPPTGSTGLGTDSVSLALPERARDTACDEDKVPQEVIMHLQLIEDMNRQGKYHAALAHLDALGKHGAPLPRARFLRAEAYRQIGDKTHARTLFAELTKSCLAGLGHHGLARVAMDEGKLDEALAGFSAAERERPTDARIRNDHGYALLIAGRVQEARYQFQTAYELGGDDTVAANLLLTLWAAGDRTAADRLAAQLSLTETEVNQIKAHAAELRRTSPAAAAPKKEGEE
jgi:Flp pilus assembly protein TadD